jgi:predicted N-acetyltransferase YhbS
MIITRPETAEDAAAIRHVNEEAFGQKEEAEIVEKLRSRGVLRIIVIGNF